MASQLFNLKLLKQAIQRRFSQIEIENQLKITKFAQFANRDILNKISMDKLEQAISDLTLLDYNIKHSLINPYLGLKLMLSK
jgi:DNA polymerase III delta subunit